MAVDRYSNGKITVTFDGDICTSAGRCVKGLPGVFDAKRKPWVNIDGADADAIEAQVKKCPSRALGFERDTN
jgi:uncharacterized Fe-S cluster protein YjdI